MQNGKKGFIRYIRSCIPSKTGKRKTLQHSWMTKDLLASLKLKQNYKKDFSKVKIHKIKRFMNNINLFLKVQRKRGKNYCKDCLKKY